MNKIKKQSNQVINKTIIKALIPFFVALIIEMFFGILSGGITAALNIEKNALFFSIFISYLVYGIFIGITKKLSISTIIISIIGTVYLIINQIKMGYTGEVLVFSDINFVSKLNGIIDMISFEDIVALLKFYLLSFVALVIIFVLIIRWTFKNDIIIEKVKERLIIIGICSIILTILFIPNKHTKEIFLKLFLNAEKGSYTTSISYCNDYSLVAGIYGILLNDRFTEPENYNEENLNNILKEYSEVENKGTWGKPNIIVVFSESFWDIDKQNDVEFYESVAPNIKKLKEEGKLIETLSCGYGRLSENIAFELLTGGSLNYFNKGYIPIMSLYKREYSEEIISILKELKYNDYRTKIVFGEDYYNSEKAMKKIGFDEYLDIETEESIENRNNITDEYITDLIIDELKNKKKDEKLFYMTETIQNHMPYKIDKYTTYDVSIKSSNLKNEMNDTILSYAQGIYDADKQLNRLYEYIKEYEEPTIILFLGDHLPYLHTESGYNVIESMSYFNTDNELENLYRKYNTQALILSNYNIDTSEIPEYLSNNLLLTYIVNQMDIELSSYYKWLYSTTEYLPATNSYMALDKNGNKYNIQELEGNMQRIYKLREYMQYKLFIKPTKR